MTELIASAGRAADQLDIITFNHDLLVENVLAELDVARTRWCLRLGYGHFAQQRRFTARNGRPMFANAERVFIRDRYASSSYTVPQLVR